jgi:peptidoglycan/LPS O-acetylase OafA/YrhL
MGLLRFLLAMSVVVEHTGPVYGLTLIPGRVAVEIFFVISGFYMSMILASKYRDVRTFYLNRALRLYPTYLLITIATWVVFGATWLYLGKMPTNNWMRYYADMPPLEAAAIIFSNWTMIGQDVLRLLHYKLGVGFFFLHFGPSDAPDGAKWVGEMQTIGQAWSLGTEIWFYLLAPGLVLLSTRYLLVGAAFSFALRFWMKDGAIDYSYFFFPCAIGFFLVGIMLERFRNSYGRFASYFPVVCPIALAASVILSGFWLPATYIILMLLLPAFFHWTKSSDVDMRIGHLSYPIYLVHGLIISVLVGLHLASPIAACTFSIIAAVLIYYLLERPIDVFRQRIAQAGRGQPAQIAA